MKREIAALLAITIVIAIGNLPLHFIVYRECYVKPFLLSQPEWLRPYIDYEPFFSTWYGISTIVVWLFLGVLWLVAFPVFKKIRGKTARAVQLTR